MVLHDVGHCRLLKSMEVKQRLMKLITNSPATVKYKVTTLVALLFHFSSEIQYGPWLDTGCGFRGSFW